ncbi:MAG: alanine--tRNA ligase [Bacteroidetes bacterium]|nr:alanine--tRNA ligase [Bacteroidota bacterium]
MKSEQIRQTFLSFFKSKGHQIVASAPMVIKNDPTLMFTNAGMNQFKDLFLGNSVIKYKRAADTQKCLRVSGKHNDLEEVGRDTYHHTMFEMLGNWSFGDYFKKEAIEWAWELLTEVYKIDKDSLYVSVFGGDKSDGLDKDMEAFNYWKKIVPEDQLLFGSKKDNFWEMGDTGPCGPCSEIHVDIRSDEEKKKVSGKELVNKDHPLIIEIWNLVFIEFNRNSNGELLALPDKHIDTGLGFERLCMVLQGVQSNYDTDIFQPIIRKIASLSKLTYGMDEKTDIAMRVIADHVRAVAFAIADGQLPSNTGAGYVIRRILRRAVRYAYTFLKVDEPFIYQLVKILTDQMGDTFPEIKSQEVLIRKVIIEEEQAFLRTLEKGIDLFDNYLLGKSTQNITHNTSSKECGKISEKIIDGYFAFKLLDTFGFPIDLTQLLAQEKGFKVDLDSFYKELQKQKDRSRNAAQKDTGDWVIENDKKQESEFIGYKNTTAEVEIVKYRKVTVKKKTHFEVVLNKTPFYAESGGQIGDNGYFIIDDKEIKVFDTKKDNNLTLHLSSDFIKPENNTIIASVNKLNRKLTTNNHSATHLMHAALREVLGSHVEQKGSLVDPQRLRFDFSHFSKVLDDELLNIEKIVNAKIRENIEAEVFEDVPLDEAKKMGAAAFFGEKYGETVRLIRFDENFSTEFCGGTHVKFTGQIGLFKIISEGAIAAGIRRIEAITGNQAESYYREKESTLAEISLLLKQPNNLLKSVQMLLTQNSQLTKQLDAFKIEKLNSLKEELTSNVILRNGFNVICKKVDLDMGAIRDLSFALDKSINNLVLLLASENNGKANLSLLISENLVQEKGLNANKIIREIAKEIKGGGGGQLNFATAGGSFPSGIDAAMQSFKKYL